MLSSSGGVLARESFGPFGERRGGNWQGQPTTGDKAVFADVSRRGFTGHEMLDAVGLVNMNGRVYDPRIGRFLSSDPIIQMIAMSQALNPYSYVMNNPLTLVDPSGYSWLSKAFSSIGKFLKKFWRPILAIVASIVTFGYLAPLASSWLATTVCLAPGTITAGGAAIAGGMAAAVSSAIMGEKLRGVLRSFAIGAAFAYVGFGIRRGIDDWANGRGSLWHVSRDPETGELLINPVQTPGTAKISVNGMHNSLHEAALNALQQSRSESVTLFYNPSNGFIADLTESALMKVTGTSSLGNQLAGILPNSAGLTDIVAHSQGTLIVSNAMGVLARHGYRFASSVNITYYGAAANRIVADDLARDLGAHFYMFNDRLDAVGNIVGLNTLNPFKIIASAIASPTLFMGPKISPHSTYP